MNEHQLAALIAAILIHGDVVAEQIYNANADDDAREWDMLTAISAVDRARSLIRRAHPNATPDTPESAS